MGLIIYNFTNMKYFAAILLLASSAEATKLNTQSQMLAEIEAMSMNANMHQVALREKTLLKTYLEVDMNEFLQEKMDSELFAGVDEKQKSEFVGNFFHFVKCRFQDCNLVQTKSKLNMKKKSEQPTIAETRAVLDKEGVELWNKNGDDTPSHSNEKAAYVQTDAKIKIDAEAERKAKQTTNTSAQVAADLEKEKSQELIKPHALAGNDKDSEPTNVQIKSDVKVEEKK